MPVLKPLFKPAFTTLDEDWLVDDVMRRWPATIRVFLDFRFNCVGCPIGIFHSIADACREHGADQTELLAALRSAAEQKVA